MNVSPDKPFDPPEPDSSSATAVLAGRRRTVLPSLIGLALAALVIVLLRTSGSLRGIADALVVMGFDLDRAILITALIAGAVAALVVAACAGRPSVAVLASVGATAAVFGATLGRETLLAIASSGATGVFDPVGWVDSVVTLVVAAAVLGWAAAMLTAIVRRFLVVAAHDARDIVRTRSVRPVRLVRHATAFVVLALLVITVPVFGDMVNFTPDSHMRAGGVPVAGSGTAAVAGDGAGTPAAAGDGAASAPDSSAIPADGASDAPGASDQPPASGNATGAGAGMVPLPADLAAGPLPGSLITTGVIAAGRPWAASAPSGQGQISGIDLPAPWSGGSITTIHAEVYLPPGYGTSHVRYPVLYEVPHALSSWVNGAGIVAMLDNLIDTGAIPPMIAVFNSERGGPYPDLECANTYDGRAHFDTYIATKLVPAIDAHFRTIATPAARVLIGDSLGGYCAVALWSHHPDLFESAVSFSGYFVSGVKAVQTRNAARPFGNNAAYEAAQSPMNIVPSMPATLADRAFLVLYADLKNTFFGSQVREFSQVLDAAKVPMAIFPARYGHSWATPRAQMPAILGLLAGRMLKLGVFGTG
jgi:enterochelin esterase-like enzyme